MVQELPFDQVMARLQDGDEDAAALVFRRFAGRLIALARQHLDAQIRQKVDPEDVVQSVFKSFFPRCADHQYHLDSWDGLWALLVTITLRKCGRKVRHFHGPNHDVRREVEGPGAGDTVTRWLGIAREPTPEEAALLAEVVEQAMRGLKERDRKILELRLQGYSAAEIGAQVRRSENTVNWVLKRIRKRLRRLWDGVGEEDEVT